MPRLIRFAGVLCLVLVAACGTASGEPATDSVAVAPPPAQTFAFEPATPSPTPTSPPPTPTPTPTPRPPTATPTPAPTATPTRTPTQPPVQAEAEPARGTAFAIGDGVLVRSLPSTKDGEAVRRLANLQELQLLGAVKGERWIVGDQDWPMAYQSWSNIWYKVDGGYVYSAFVFIPRPGESSPFVRGTRSIRVDIRTQTLRAFVGDQVVYTAPVTTGKDEYDTPTGRFTVGSWGRVANETMTSSQAGITNPAEQYNVKNVLFTQYFDNLGDALHLNYWQPESVFGTTRTSHGCVGLLVHDAQWVWLFTQGGVPLVIE